MLLLSPRQEEVKGKTKIERKKLRLLKEGNIMCLFTETLYE